MTPLQQLGGAETDGALQLVLRLPSVRAVATHRHSHTH